MYTLYGIDESGSCMIEIALQRCAVPWRRVDAASWADGEGSAELARINPLKQVPTLVTPDGKVLTESAAILIHLGLEFPHAHLLSGDRAAILRLGAVQEGIVRHERIMPDGRKRNSVRFSIIDSEWPQVKAALQAKLQR